MSRLKDRYTNDVAPALSKEFGWSNDQISSALALRFALFGLMGAYAVTVLKLRLNPTGLIITLALNAFITFGIPGISIWAHVGGLVTGAVVTVALLYAPEANQARWQAAGIAIIVLAIVGLLAFQAAQFGTATCGFIPYRGVQTYVCG